MNDLFVTKIVATIIVVAFGIFVGFFMKDAVDEREWRFIILEGGCELAIITFVIGLWS